MALSALECLILHLLLFSAVVLGSGPSPPDVEEQTFQPSIRRQMDDLTPDTSVPIINPSPTTMPIVNPYPGYPSLPPFTPIITSPPSATTTSLSGRAWCIASQSASQTALQVALDYACGYGGADCSAIQQGGSCFNPDNVHSHASYAFNSYYQKNPVSTSCDFGGTAVITTTDPSTANCQYPASSAAFNQMPPTTGNPTTPSTSTTTPYVFGTPPPAFGDNSGLSGSTHLSMFVPVHFMLLLAATIANL